MESNTSQAVVDDASRGSIDSLLPMVESSYRGFLDMLKSSRESFKHVQRLDLSGDPFDDRTRTICYVFTLTGQRATSYIEAVAQYDKWMLEQQKGYMDRFDTLVLRLSTSSNLPRP